MRGPIEDSGYEELRPRRSVLLLVKITKVDQNLLRMKLLLKNQLHQRVFSFLILQNLLFYRIMITYTVTTICQL